MLENTQTYINAVYLQLSMCILQYKKTTTKKQDSTFKMKKYWGSSVSSFFLLVLASLPTISCFWLFYCSKLDCPGWRTIGFNTGFSLLPIRHKTINHNIKFDGNHTVSNCNYCEHGVRLPRVDTTVWCSRVCATSIYFVYWKGSAGKLLRMTIPSAENAK